MRLRSALPLVVIGAAVAAACCQARLPAVTSGTGQEGDRQPIRVCVSVLPEAFIVDRVGGDRVSVTEMAGAGQSPHAFEPTPTLIARLSESEICFTLGLPFERTVLRDLLRSDPNLLVFDAAAGIDRRTLETHGHHHGGNSTEGSGATRVAGGSLAVGTDGGEPDPHVWLSPRAAAVIAQNVRDGLVAFDPADSTYFDANLAALKRELGELDAELAATLAPYAGGTIYVFHPAYGYFTDEYGLRQSAIEVEGKEPSPRDLAEVVTEAKRDGARVIFVQPQHPARIARTVADEIGARVVVLDPLAYDYFGELRKMAGEMADALSGSRRPSDSIGRRASEEQ